ncbi:hypothetical protein ACFFIX_00685 [Metabacillus herbersteinensis]|uniref:DUF2178 domain-containing protein n=1 Tax=Metabacillus herbersteinensis TaxID=283816 RepID=A0ABV6G8G3_9BACI
MKKLLQPALLNIVTIILFGWALTAFYMAQVQFAEIIKDPEPPWEISVNIVPLLIFFVICTPISFYLTIRNKKKHGGLWKTFMLPPEFEEADEREQLITAKACRASYITMWFVTPIAAGLLLLHPFVEKWLPYYPILVILVIPLAQILSYFISLKKNI